MSAVSQAGQEILRRLSVTGFAENYNIRSDTPGVIATVARASKIYETKSERDTAMTNAAKVMAGFLSQADLNGLKGIEKYTITNNLISLRERMLDNATSNSALTSIETYMNRAIGSLNPTIADRVFGAVGFIAKVLVFGRGMTL